MNPFGFTINKDNSFRMGKPGNRFSRKHLLNKRSMLVILWEVGKEMSLLPECIPQIPNKCSRRMFQNKMPALKYNATQSLLGFGNHLSILDQVGDVCWGTHF